MRTEWEFRFEARGIFFVDEQEFKGDVQINSESKESISFQVRIVPGNDKTSPGADDCCKIFITVPGTPEGSEDLAYFVLMQMKTKMEFPDAQVTIGGGFVCTRKIPDTTLEEEEIGDNPYGVTVCFEEEPRRLPQFNPKQLTELGSGVGIDVIAQFNQANQATNPVDRFLGFYKILEKVYADGRGGNPLRELKANDALWGLASPIISKESKTEASRDEFDKLLSTFARIRDNCAHWRGKTGYVAGDPRIPTEVEPYLNLVRLLAEKTIAGA